LDEWKQIKAAGGPSAYAEQKKKDKTPSPKLSRKSSQKQSKKRKDHHKELHWFEKELGKIEKEKQRLERERHKYIEREERYICWSSFIISTKYQQLFVLDCQNYAIRC